MGGKGKLGLFWGGKVKVGYSGSAKWFSKCQVKLEVTFEHGWGLPIGENKFGIAFKVKRSKVKVTVVNSSERVSGP